jgi:hypothetical protein
MAIAPNLREKKNLLYSTLLVAAPDAHFDVTIRLSKLNFEFYCRKVVDKDSRTDL